MLGDDDGSSSGSYDPLGGEVDLRVLCAVGALLLLIASCDAKRIHGHRQAAHKESAERQVKEVVARWEEEKPKREAEAQRRRERAP